MPASTLTLEDKLVELDCTVASLAAVQQLLSYCPPELEVNANALGHLLFVLHKEFQRVQHLLDEPDATVVNE